MSDPTPLIRALLDRAEAAEAQRDTLAEALREIATFRDGQYLADQQAFLLRERARIGLALSATREAAFTSDSASLAEIAALWADYCAGGLDMAALAQEIGEVLDARAALAGVAPPEAET